MLLEEFLKPLGLTQRELAEAIGREGSAGKRNRVPRLPSQTKGRDGRREGCQDDQQREDRTERLSPRGGVHAANEHDAQPGLFGEYRPIPLRLRTPSLQL